MKTFVPDISMSQLQYLQKEDVDLVLSLLDFRLRFISPNSPLFEERFVFSGGDGLDGYRCNARHYVIKS